MISLLHAAVAAACASAAPPSRMAVAAGALLRVSHRVTDLASTAAFYEEILGLERDSPAAARCMLQAPGGAGLALELVEDAAGTFKPDAGHRDLSARVPGYQGLSARVPSVADAVAAAAAAGGSILSEPAAVEHGASHTPDEPEENANVILEAVVADPSGYPLLLHECVDAQAACLSGARLDVYEWKRSQEWWESLGWSIQRWNSNVHREASLTVTVGADAAPADAPIGPRGPLPPASHPVLQLTYVYGCRPVAQPAEGSLASVVLAAADGAPAELADPDGYRVLLE